MPVVITKSGLLRSLTECSVVALTGAPDVDSSSNLTSLCLLEAASHAGELSTVRFKEGCDGSAACTGTGGGSGGCDCEEAFGPYGLMALAFD